MISKETLLRNLEELRASLCCYVGSEHFCDCKYIPKVSLVRHSEHTGCSEIRKVMRILELISDEEFTALSKKADGYRKTE